MDKVLEITSNDHIIMIDKLCKRIIGHPEILGRITLIKNLMKKMAIPLDKAMELLDLSSVEKKRNEKIFSSLKERATTRSFVY